MQQDCIRERGKQINLHSDEITLMQQIFGGYLRSMVLPDETTSLFNLSREFFSVS